MARGTASGYSLTQQDASIVAGMQARGDGDHDIACWFGVNQGRVAEVKEGKFGTVHAAPAAQLPPKEPPGIKGRRLRYLKEVHMRVMTVVIFLTALAIVPSSAQTDQREPNTPNTKPFLAQLPPAPFYVPGPAGPAAPPSVTPEPNDPPASNAPAPDGNVPSKIPLATTPFAGTGEKAPEAKSLAGQSSPPSTTAFGPGLVYWENGNYQTQNESTCTINLAPTITFYIQYFDCAWNLCGGGFGANPYRWSFWLYRNGQVYWSQSGVLSSQVWINNPIILPTPLPPGTYHGELKYEKRVFIATWQTQFDTTTNSIQIIQPSQPYWQAPAPQLRVEVVANAGNDMLYQLRGWQVNGNASLQPQWNLYNSDSAGTEIPPPISVTWSAMGVPYTIPSNLNLNQWYTLRYGNYSACYSWNDTRRLIYIGK